MPRQTAEDPSIPLNSANDTGSTSIVLLMVRDAYANYVVQTTLDVLSESEEKKLLLAELNAHSDELVSFIARISLRLFFPPYFLHYLSRT